MMNAITVQARGAALIETALLVAFLAVVTAPIIQKFGVQVRQPFCAYMNFRHISPEYPPSHFIVGEGEQCRIGTAFGGGAFYW